jgi:hypothetical protein
MASTGYVKTHKQNHCTRINRTSFEQGAKEQGAKYTREAISQPRVNRERSTPKYTGGFYGGGSLSTSHMAAYNIVGHTTEVAAVNVIVLCIVLI